MAYFSTDSADYIIEKYKDSERGLNPHTLSDAWFRVREWNEKEHKYIIHDGFGSRTIVEIILQHRGIDIHKLPPTVDQYLD